MTSDVVATALAACAARLGDDATAVLSRLAGPHGEAARAAARDLVALDASAIQRRRAELAVALRTPALAALRGVHPTWIDAAVAGLPERARTALVSPAADALDPAEVWLARWAASTLPPPALATQPAEPAAVVAWLRSIALDQLAYALGPQAAGPAAPPLLREAAARIARPPRLHALGSQRAALVRCRGAQLDDELSLLAVAGRTLAPHLASRPLAALALTRRLPYAQGSVIERELLAHASTSLSDVPTLGALGMPAALAAVHGNQGP